MNGIEIQNGASNLIGGTICCSGNVISANQGNGILITAAAAIRNQVLGNYIGTDATGLAGLGNHQDGVKTAAAANKNTIGGTSLLARNLISGNLGDGIELGTTANFVQENWIGVDATGNAALPNLLDGVRVLVSRNTLTHNVISKNGANGVELLTGVQTTKIKGNMIGVNVQGNQPLGNTLDGIHLLTASANIIGGAGFGAGNVISGNTNGITLVGASVSNIIQGNFVGTDLTGTQKIMNTADGIDVNSLANNNSIGGSTLGTGNVISGNGDLGVLVDSDNNKIQGNRIGTDVTGTQALGNAFDGVYVEEGIRNVVGGSATGTNWGGPRNIIAANGRNGVVIRAKASLTMVQGNYIGVGLNGEHLGNADSGVFLPAGSTGSGNIIGVPYPGLSPTPAYEPRANVIGYNNQYGVDVSGGTQTYVGENDYLANVAGPTNSFASPLTGVPITVPATSLITVHYPTGTTGWIEFYQICNNNYYFVTRVKVNANGGTYSFDATTYGLATGDTVTATFTTTPLGTSKF
ncbi:MAG TPA: hypothetical protein VHR66_15580 [Gemmataceae bacterium]|nr:hypothetical protein [Gemmataceae bacterium]